MSELPLISRGETNDPILKYKIALCSIGQCLGGIGQGMFLPLFIGTFDNNSQGSTGAYFVFFMMSALFIGPFGLASIFDWYTGKLTINMIKSNLYVLIIMGICDAFNGIMVVFTSALGRTSGDLQAVLVQLTIPVTLIFSKYIA